MSKQVTHVIITMVAPCYHRDMIGFMYMHVVLGNICPGRVPDRITFYSLYITM